MHGEYQACMGVAARRGACVKRVQGAHEMEYVVFGLFYVRKSSPSQEGRSMNEAEACHVQPPVLVQHEVPRVESECQSECQSGWKASAKSANPHEIARGARVQEKSRRPTWPSGAPEGMQLVTQNCGNRSRKPRARGAEGV